MLQCSGSERLFVIHPDVTGEYKYSVSIFYQFLLIAHGPTALWVILCPSPLTFLSLCHSHSAKPCLSKQEQWFKPHLYNPPVFFFLFTHWPNVGVENSTRSVHRRSASTQIKGMCGICCHSSDRERKDGWAECEDVRSPQKGSAAPPLPSPRPPLPPQSQRTKAL